MLFDRKTKCGECDFISGVFKLTDSVENDNKHQVHHPVFLMLRHFERYGRIELYAGDCTTKEFVEREDWEDHFTWCFYFRCKTCGKYFFIGMCIRGTPGFRIQDTVTDTDLRILWGKEGAYFNSRD